MFQYYSEEVQVSECVDNVRLQARILIMIVHVQFCIENKRNKKVLWYYSL